MYMYLGLIKWLMNPIYQQIIITCFRKTGPREVNNSTVDLHKDSPLGFPCSIVKIIWTATLTKWMNIEHSQQWGLKKWKSYGDWNFLTEVKGNQNGKKKNFNINIEREFELWRQMEETWPKMLDWNGNLKKKGSVACWEVMCPIFCSTKIHMYK